MKFNLNNTRHKGIESDRGECRSGLTLPSERRSDDCYNSLQYTEMIYFFLVCVDTEGALRAEEPDMAKDILMIDDDKSLVELVREYLEQHGFNVLEANTPQDGFVMLERCAPELILLDVMLPGKTGFEICKEIRKNSDVPIIMLTARGSVIDRILGLELGADDYLPKPFEPRELLARIIAILRRGRSVSSPEARVLEFEDLSIDLLQRTVVLKGKPIAMTTTEFDLLTLFSARPNETLNRDQISMHLRGTEWEAVSRSVDAVMSRLRQKLEDDPKHPRFFRTIWGTGYMFIAKAPVNSQ